MWHLVFIATLFLVFASCQREEKSVFIEFDHSEGLKTKNDVLLNGVSVGTVLDIGISKDYTVIATVHLSDSVDFLNDSGFENQSQDLFTKMIFVTPGKSKSFLKNGDTLQGISSLGKQNSCEDDPSKLLNEIKEMLKN